MAEDGYYAAISAAVPAALVAVAGPEQDEEDQKDPDPAVVVVIGTEHGVIPFPALFLQRPPRADAVSRAAG